jgi:uncharacterized RDD family membrane protein YckC
MNPYEVPSTTQPTVVPGMEGTMRLASQGQRFLTSIIDNVVLYGINFGVGLVLGIVLLAAAGGEITKETELTINLIAMVVGIFVAILYYFAMEVATGTTVGKLVMGTKVVSADGGKPTTGQILGRSFCRLIPFEAFSFLGNKGFPIGWHDSIPGTRVIKTR